MSGNPFRTSPAPSQTTTAPPPISTSTARDGNRASWARVERDSDAGLDAASALPPAKTKKSVRIESPSETSPPHPALHEAYDSFPQRVGTAQYAPPPAFGSSAGFPDTPGDSASSGIGRREGVDTRGSMGALRRDIDAPEAARSPSGVPANPFSKTLATIEPNERGGGEHAGQSRDRTPADRSTSTPTKPSLDVESFKNMLMTGISSPRSSGLPPAPTPSSQQQNPPAFESSSSTDTSSVSRQSLFEPVPEPHPETPRTSYEMAASDDENISLMGERRAEKREKREKKKPPPAPRHRHGKLVTSRTPQTVSFDDFKVVEPTTSPPAAKRDDSDLNKPLPPTPPVFSNSQNSHIASQDITQDLPPSDPKPADISPSRTEDLPPLSITTKKTPPPVPLTRRHSQLRTSVNAGPRSRSNSSLTMSSQHSIELPTPSPSIYDQTPSPSSSQKIPPPPPPTRHRGAALSTSASSSTTELSIPPPSAPTPRRPTLSTPNPPPARRSTLSSDPPSPAGASLARSPSTTSNRPANRAVSNESTGSASMPPPPPPPRKRMSTSRSSLDKERPTLSSITGAPPTSPGGSARTSAECKRSSMEGRRRTSVASESSLKYAYVAPDEAADAPVSSLPEESGSGNKDGHVVLEKENQGVKKEDEGESGSGGNVRASTILDDMEKFQREIEELRERYRHAA